MKAVIMAGGSGTRLRPLTCTIPKPMVPVLNRPVMEYTIGLLARNGISDIAVTLQYLPDEIMDYFKDGENRNVRLTYFTETKPLGTAGSVKNAKAFLDEPFIVISGDALTDLDIRQAVSWHQQKNSTATLVTKKVDIPLEFGLVVSDQDNRIVRFLEKPGWGEVFTDQANTGIYLFDPVIFDHIGDGQVDFARDVFPAMLAAGIGLYAYPMESYWCDIGDIAQYMQANFDLLDGKCKLPISALNVSGIYFENANDANKNILNIESPAYIGTDALLDPHCRIKKHSVIGKGCRIGEAEIERGILWDNAFAADGVQIRGAILCSGSQAEKQSFFSEESVLGVSSVVGERSVLYPGVRVWPDKKVDACTKQDENMVWGNVRKKLVFAEGGFTGKAPADLSPQLAAWIGQVFAFSKNNLVIGCDGKAASDMAAKGILSGILSQHCNGLDLDFCTPAVLRHAIVTLEQNGGVYVRDLGNGECRVQLYDERGLTLSRKMEKSLEERFRQQEIFKGQNGKAITKRRIMPLYQNDLLRSVLQNGRDHRRFRIALGALHPKLKRGVLSFFSQLGCETAYVSSGVSKAVQNNGLDAGFEFDELLENMVIYNEQGRMIQSIELLPSYLEMLFADIGHIPVPAAFPSLVREYVQEAGRIPVECRNSADYALKTIYDNNETDTAVNRFLSYLHFDVLFEAAMFLKAIAMIGCNASEVMGEMGNVIRRYTDVSCRDSDIGKVMRELSEEGWMPAAEGVSFESDRGSVNVYHAGSGTLRISAASIDSEIAEEMLSVYSDRISQITENIRQ